MVISFSVEKARKQLEDKGVVYTLRLNKRKRVGKTWYNHFRGDTKKGDVYIYYVGDFLNRTYQLKHYVINSGFGSLREWLEKAKESRFLYEVVID